ncbi:glycosyltransferase family 2 protein [Marinimicrobium sp. ARAG 43.8]|uniref:glycosyltransferase family 2 protein n=1 Tax=Marinimicrobium sp. ARAG 43.8 TaxID=3418719 RepID=UPI003CF6974E
MTDTERRFVPCAIIPVYRHAHLLEHFLPRIRAFGLPCIVVDDGNEKEQADILKRLCAETRSERLRLAVNAGKGAAVLQGMRHALALGYSHGIQVDADGQHNIDDIPRLLEWAGREPDAVITGVPQYDDSIPRHRLYSRYITHFWVWVETLSMEIRDSMCGFRAYPLGATLAMADRVSLGRRMDFDTEVLVRLSWRGVPIRSMPTRVIYPDNGVSNFDLWRDNIAISWMHTRLCLGMLLRLPRLLWRRWISKR